MRYREHTPIVLNELNLSIAAREKIGIVEEPDLASHHL
uniref:Uncharacterized protein n=1 Tax=Anguilla anguilla TaxID=7936 RepID=A0A0E9V7A3_ANGAN